MAGHRVVLVENDGALARALELDRVDLVLTDVADADHMSKQATSPSRPTVLPVMYEPTKAEVKEIINVASRDQIVGRYPVTIDSAMKARADQKKRK